MKDNHPLSRCSGATPTEGYGIFIENMLNASNARNELPAA